MTTTNTTTYSINTTDTETAQRWQDAPGIVKMVPGPQDGGRCRWTVQTTDAPALESALDADDAVIEYSAATTATLRNYKTGAAIRPATLEELEASRAEIERGRHEGVIVVDGVSCYVEE